MNNSTHHRASRYGWIGGAILMLPLMAASESNVQTDGSKTAAVTTHVNFKIVIPKVLYFRVNGERTTAGKTVAIMSNNRNVVLTAGSREPATSQAQRSVILSAAARKSIEQDAVCSLRDRFSTQLICTASMP